MKKIKIITIPVVVIVEENDRYDSSPFRLGDYDQTQIKKHVEEAFQTFNQVEHDYKVIAVIVDGYTERPAVQHEG